MELSNFPAYKWADNASYEDSSRTTGQNPNYSIFSKAAEIY